MLAHTFRSPFSSVINSDSDELIFIPVRRKPTQSKQEGTARESGLKIK